MRLWTGALAALLFGSGCDKAEPEAAPASSARGLLPPAVPLVPRAPVPAQSIDLVEQLSRCELEHYGRLFDFGTGQLPFGGFAAARAEPPPTIDRGDDRYERVFSRDVVLDFWLAEPTENVSVSLRLYPLVARALQVSIDDKRLGQQKLLSGETRTLVFPAVPGPLARGRHRVSLRLSGAPRGTKEPLVDLDWVRVGPAADDAGSYAAPTLRDVVSDVVLDGVPKRSIVLRAPSVVRCYLRPAPDARLRVGLGFWGTGRGVAEIALVTDDRPARVLASRKLSGGDSASFTPVLQDLAPAAGDVVGLELRALEGTRGGRVVFGDPAITPGRAELPRVPGARTIVIVVLASADRARLPPWGPTGGLRVLGDLAKHAVAFSAHRAPSSVPAASLGSLLTGLSPTVHGIETAGEKLREKVVTLAETVKEAGGRTAFFTGAPSSFAPFGLSAGFDTFEAISPVSDLPASEPLARATSFLEQELSRAGSAQQLLVVELRGAHPPWDLTREETLGLKPLEYAGILDPRRGGIVLGALRGKQRKVARRIGDDDWIRLREMHDAVLVKQDAALGRLIALLKEKNAWNDCLLMVTSEVGFGNGPDIPFDPQGPLTEDRLLLPLLVKFPGDALAGRVVTLPTRAQDLAFTSLRAFGLDVPKGTGSDLFTRASGHPALSGDVDLATALPHYSARLGDWLLRGQVGHVPQLCAQDIDPACTTDLFDQKTMAARALWLSVFSTAAHAERASASLGPRLRAELDPATQAALTVWGDLR